MQERYELDPGHTLIGFSAKHLGLTTVRGHFQKFEGWLEGDRDTLKVAGEVTLDVASLTTAQEQRDGHLRSADFFDADQHPTATYRITGIERTGGDGYRVSGELTIKETTRPLILEATVEGELDHPFEPGARILSVTARGKIDRMEFGLNWDGLAGSIPLASHAIKLEVETELKSKPGIEAQTAVAL